MEHHDDDALDGGSIATVARLGERVNNLRADVKEIKDTLKLVGLGVLGSLAATIFQFIFNHSVGK